MVREGYLQLGDQVVPAAGRDDTLPMLTGVRIDIDGDTMWLACTDRYRIAARELTWSPAEAGFTAGVVVPARTLADTAKAIRPGAEVALDLTGAADTLIGVSGGGRSMTSRLLDDQYINYRSRLTGDWSSVAAWSARETVLAARCCTATVACAGTGTEKSVAAIELAYVSTAAKTCTGNRQISRRTHKRFIRFSSK